MEVLHRSGIHRPTCFWAQQICEKLLKGAIQEKKEHPPKTHDLLRLKKLSGMDIQGLDDDLKFLSNLYIDSRYPEDFAIFPTGEPDAEDAKRAVDIATAMIGHFKNKYGL